MHGAWIPARLGVPLLLFGAMLPATMPVPVFKEIVADRAGGHAAVAWYTAVAMLASFVCAPLAGLWSDRSGGRGRIVAGAALINGACLMGVPRMPDLFGLLTLRIIEGASSSFVLGILLAGLADVERANHTSRGHGVGLAGMVLVLGAGAGLPLGAGLARVHVELPFIVAGALVWLVGLVAACVAWPQATPRPPQVSADTRRAPLVTPALTVALTAAFSERFAAGFLSSALNLHLREGLGLSAAQSGLYLALVMLPLAVLAYPTVWLCNRTPPARIAAVGAGLYGVGLALSGSLSDPTLVPGCLLLAGTGAGLLHTAALLTAVRASPPDSSGRVMATFFGTGSLGFLLGPLSAVGLEHLLRSPDFSVLAFAAGAVTALPIVVLGLVRVFRPRVFPPEAMPHLPPAPHTQRA